jgi:hypothetical protein
VVILVSQYLAFGDRNEKEVMQQFNAIMQRDKAPEPLEEETVATE